MPFPLPACIAACLICQARRPCPAPHLPTASASLPRLPMCAARKFPADTPAAVLKLFNVGTSCDGPADADRPKGKEGEGDSGAHVFPTNRGLHLLSERYCRQELEQQAAGRAGQQSATSSKIQR